MFVENNKTLERERDKRKMTIYEIKHTWLMILLDYLSEIFRDKLHCLCR